METKNKKQWLKPELEIISHGYVDAKSHPSVHEATGHSSRGLFFINKSDNGFKGTKYEAIS